MKRYRIKSKFRFTAAIAIMMVTMIFTIGSVFGVYDALSATKPVYTEVLIQSGDTLWHIARNFASENQDTRAVVHEICKLNDITADTVFPGQSILVPVYM